MTEEGYKGRWNEYSSENGLNEDVCCNEKQKKILSTKHHTYMIHMYHICMIVIEILMYTGTLSLKLVTVQSSQGSGVWTTTFFVDLYPSICSLPNSLSVIHGPSSIFYNHYRRGEIYVKQAKMDTGRLNGKAPMGKKQVLNGEGNELEQTVEGKRTKLMKEVVP